MVPKLLAKFQARSANLSDDEALRFRAVPSQIGWLGTSMADAAAQAVSNVELFLTSGVSGDATAIDNQLKFFESYEGGLLATWRRGIPSYACHVYDLKIAIPRPLSFLIGLVRDARPSDYQ
jgi:hypothetical protein